MWDKTLPIGGGWIIVTRQPPTEIKPPLLSMFYAMPDRVFAQGTHTARFGADAWGSQHSPVELSLLWRSRRGSRLSGSEKDAAEKLEAEGFALDQRVHIITDEGDCWLEPYEWSPCGSVEPFLAFAGTEHVKLHMLGGAEIDGKMKDMVFYMQSRGIKRVDALQLLLGKIRKPNICWLQLHEAYAEIFC